MTMACPIPISFPEGVNQTSTGIHIHIYGSFVPLSLKQKYVRRWLTGCFYHLSKILISDYYFVGFRRNYNRHLPDRHHLH